MASCPPLVLLNYCDSYKRRYYLGRVVVVSNPYVLEDARKKRFIKIVDMLINSDDVHEVDLTGTGVNFYTLGEILEELGYEKGDYDTNGWQIDLDITYTKEGCESLVVHGTALVFEIKLSKKSYYNGEI